MILSFPSLLGVAPPAAALRARHTAPSLVRTTWATTNHPLLFLVLLAGVATLGSDAMKIGSCATKTPSRAHQLLDQARLLGLKERRGRSGRKLLGETCEELPAICDQCVNIPIYVHLLAYPTTPGESDLEYFIPHPIDAEGYVAAESTTPEMMLSMVQENVDLANTVFQGTPFQFTLMADDYTISVDANWTQLASDYTHEMSEKLRKGGMESLNLYLAYALCSEVDVDNTCSAVGFAVLPSAQADDDGIWMLYDTVTGGGLTDQDLGYSLVHEIGHWLGLYHTFQNSLAAMFVGEIDGDPCSDSNTNDFVDDTGVHAGPSQDSYNCTDFLFPDEQVELLVVPDTCPGQELLDPFFNIMNYVSHEVCFEATEAKFTCGQVERMWLQWNLYRDAINTCGEDEMVVDIVVQYDNCEYPPQNPFYLSTVGSSEPIFDSATDLDTVYIHYYEQDTILVDLCVPRGEEYEYVVRDSVGDGTARSPAIILVDGTFECELPGDFGSVAKVLFNASSMDCNGTPVRNPNEPAVDPPSEPPSKPPSMPPSMPPSVDNGSSSTTAASIPPSLDDGSSSTTAASMPPSVDDGSSSAAEVSMPSSLDDGSSSGATASMPPSFLDGGSSSGAMASMPRGGWSMGSFFSSLAIASFLTFGVVLLVERR